MRIPTNFILRLLYKPKKIFLSRTMLACIIVSVFAGGAVYVKQRNVQRQVVEYSESELHNLDSNYAQSLESMQAHIIALNSRIKHLSMDNKRLSSTGQKLAEQIHTTSTTIRERLAKNKELQIELYAIDQHLIHKYDSFIEGQKSVLQLHEDCEKNKSKAGKCHNYMELKQALEESTAQIKFLKAKREILLSEITRASIGI